jgi:hypothetical protein
MSVILPSKYLCNTPQESLTRRKILRHRADGFTSPPKEVTLRIFSHHKSIVLGRVWTPRTLSPMAGTITTRLPRTTNDIFARILRWKYALVSSPHIFKYITNNYLNMSQFAQYHETTFYSIYQLLMFTCISLCLVFLPCNEATFCNKSYLTILFLLLLLEKYIFPDGYFQ